MLEPDRPATWVPAVPTRALTLRAATAQLLEHVTAGQWRRKRAEHVAADGIAARLDELGTPAPATLGDALDRLAERRVGSPSPRAWQIATRLIDRHGLARTVRATADGWDPAAAGDAALFARLLEAVAWYSVRPDVGEFDPQTAARKLRLGEDLDEAGIVRALPSGAPLALHSDLTAIDRTGRLWAHQRWLAGWDDHRAAAQRVDVTPGARLVTGDPNDTLWTTVALGRLEPERCPEWVALRLVDIIV